MCDTHLGAGTAGLRTRSRRTPDTITAIRTSTLNSMRPICRNTDSKLVMTMNGPTTSVTLSTLLLSFCQAGSAGGLAE